MVPFDEAFAIGFNVPITSMDFTVRPEAKTRTWQNDERDIYYIQLVDFEQGSEYSIDITGAPADADAWNAEQVQSTGQFLIDRHGIVRWRSVEGETDGLRGVTRFASHDDVLRAARAL